uniref:Secreted protein n=1 Tax=Rhipicephalus appendiculatus TaxID=34631 RepID=A0A131YDH2_RHIAP
MKLLALLNTLVVLMVITKSNGSTDTVEKIMETMGKAAATAGYTATRWIGAFLRGLQKERAKLLNKSVEEPTKGSEPHVPQGALVVAPTKTG